MATLAYAIMVNTTDTNHASGCSVIVWNPIVVTHARTNPNTPTFNIITTGKNSTEMNSMNFFMALYYLSKKRKEHLSAQFITA